MLDTFIGMPLMLAEIIAAECMFTVSLKKRQMYWLRLIAASLDCLLIMWSTLVVYVVVTGDFYTYNGNGVGSFGMTAFKFFLYVFIFAMTIFAMIFCCEDTVWRTMYYCAGAYVTQHMAKNIAGFIFAVGRNVWIYSRYRQQRARYTHNRKKSVLPRKRYKAYL